MTSMARGGSNGNKKRLQKQSFLLVAGATGFEPAVSALTGPHVKPLHHAPEPQDNITTK